MDLPFKITSLLFIRNPAGHFLMLKRTKAPNKDCWSPPGGKLEMSTGESPYECAIREAGEETGMTLGAEDLHLWGMISEKSFEGAGHWLMFMFDVHPRLETLPPRLDEGRFAFFPRETIESLAIPATDRVLLWPYYDQYKHAFVAYRVDCRPGGNLEIVVEQITGLPQQSR